MIFSTNNLTHVTFDKWRENWGIVEIGSDCTVDYKCHTHLTLKNFRGRMWAAVAFSMYKCTQNVKSVCMG